MKYRIVKSKWKGRHIYECQEKQAGAYHVMTTNRDLCLFDAWTCDEKDTAIFDTFKEAKAFLEREINDSLEETVFKFSTKKKKKKKKQ